MKIEVGKYYKTRGGRKVRIYAVDGECLYSVHGALFEADNKGWICCVWTEEGRLISNTEADYDIVSEWTEPKPRLYAYLDNLGDIRFHGASDIDLGHLRRAPWLDEPEEK